MRDSGADDGSRRGLPISARAPVGRPRVPPSPRARAEQWLIGASSPERLVDALADPAGRSVRGAAGAVGARGPAPDERAQPVEKAQEPPPQPQRRFGNRSRTSGLRVLLITESTYPFHFGGVSTWCRNLITGLPDVDFQILALVADPDILPLFDRPANVSALTTLPLWGVREARETRRSPRRAELRRARATPDERALAEGLGRPLRGLVEALFSGSADPFAVADEVNALYEFFLDHDFDASMRSRAAWEAFAAGAQASFPAAARAAGYGDVPIGAADVLTGLHWLAHWLIPLSRALPEVDVAHATMAGECILPAVAAKLHHGAGLVFSEHGVHLREVYLREAADDGSLFLKLLKIGFALRTSEMAYAISDRISTCCDYNKRWAIGGRAERVQTIHYGLDPVDALEVAAPANPAPVITWLGRIDPLKDIETLLRAAAIVHAQRGEAVFRLYGAAGPERADYHARLLALRRELGLTEVVELPGYTADPQRAYGESDIVVLTSISEGFPYATLEAMGAGKPVVATAVGGLPEQVGDCGVLVVPQNPEALAGALVSLIDDPQTRERLGAAARRRVRETFDLEHKNREHLAAYAIAAAGDDGPTARLELAFADGPVAPAGAVNDALLDAVCAQVPHPVDHREIAAVLEARGITDATARSRYGAPDTFRLAAAILSRMPRRSGEAGPQPHRIVPTDRPQRRIPRAADGLLALLPAAVLVGVGLWARSIAGWTAGTSRALLLGLAGATLLGTAFQFAVMRRGALLIGCGRWSALRRFLWRWSAAALLAALAADLAGVLAASALARLSDQQADAFGLSFAALVLFWVLGSGLVVVRHGHDIGLATLAGAAVGAAVYLGSGAGSAAHVEVALAAGYGAAIAAIAARVGVLVGGRGRGPQVPRLPRLRYLLREAAPFVCYGVLLIVLVLGPTVATALHATFAGSSQWRSVAVGMTFALAPLMLSIPLAEVAQLAMSERLSTVMSETAIADAGSAAERLRASNRRASLRYLASVALLGAIAVPAVWLLARAGALGGLGSDSTGALLLALAISSLAYLLIARTHLDVMGAIALGYAGLALPCVAAGVATAALVASIGFSTGLAQSGPLSLLAGSAVAALLADRGAKRFLADLTRHLVGAM